MSGQSTSTLSALLKPTFENGVIDLAYRQTDFLNVLRSYGKVSPTVGGAPFSWVVVTVVNGSAEVFTEGQAPPAAGKQTFANTSLLPFYVRGVAGRTGHQRDNERRNGYYTNPTDVEQMLLNSDVMKKLEDTLCGSTQDQGFSTMIDSTGTYAGLSQSSTSIWASQEDGSIGVLSNSAMATLYTELTSASQSSVSRGANPSHWLMPSNQIQNYGATVGPLAASGSLVRIQQGAGMDFGLPGIPSGTGGPETAFSCMGIPIMRVRGITTTEVYLVDMTDISLEVHRDLEVAPIVGNPEQEQWSVSMAVALKIHSRNKHGKLTGVTA